MSSVFENKIIRRFSIYSPVHIRGFTRAIEHFIALKTLRRPEDYLKLVLKIITNAMFFVHVASEYIDDLFIGILLGKRGVPGGMD